MGRSFVPSQTPEPQVAREHRAAGRDGHGGGRREQALVQILTLLLPKWVTLVKLLNLCASTPHL